MWTYRYTAVEHLSFAIGPFKTIEKEESSDADCICSIYLLNCQILLCNSHRYSSSLFGLQKFRLRLLTNNYLKNFLFFSRIFFPFLLKTQHHKRRRKRRSQLHEYMFEAPLSKEKLVNLPQRAQKSFYSLFKNDTASCGNTTTTNYRVL